MNNGKSKRFTVATQTCETQSRGIAQHHYNFLQIFMYLFKYVLKCNEH